MFFFFFAFLVNSGKTGLKGEFCIQNRENSIFFQTLGPRSPLQHHPGSPNSRCFRLLWTFLQVFFFVNLSITAGAAQHFTAGNVGKMDFYGC